MENGIVRKTAALSLALLTLLTAACSPADQEGGPEPTATLSPPEEIASAVTDGAVTR